MPIFVLVALLLMFCTQVSYARDDDQSRLLNKCANLLKKPSYCSCIMGKPYNEMIARLKKQQVSADARNLKMLEDRYNDNYQRILHQGDINAGQVEEICAIRQEYDTFIKSNGYDKKVSKGSHPYLAHKEKLSKEDKQAINLKRTEYRKKIHDLLTVYKVSTPTYGMMWPQGGPCALRQKIEDAKKSLSDKTTEVENLPVEEIGFSFQKLQEEAADRCSSLL